ncbi:MAG: 2-oxoacid:acceptor oxidoreductase subunit alpha [Chlorobiaceae bacterium]|nr:2-oxoacid:acceptor oxidoreductase subunit alpha [Chlorobiaceae bacterium]
MHDERRDITLVFEGEAGQGIQTVAATILPILKNSGYHLFSCTEYMSRIRGGSNSVEIRVTGRKREAYTSRIDVLFAMSPLAFDRLNGRIVNETLILAEQESFGGPWGQNCFDLPLHQLARQAGGAVFANTVVAGAALALLGIPAERFAMYLKEKFSPKGERVVEGNLHAAELGYDFIAKLSSSSLPIKPPLPMTSPGGERLLLDGTTALGIGALLAGCNFISSYPMSPGTGLLTFLAAHAADFGIVVDQAEDEIAAVNAALGASYAGARAIVTTSGGGFDLMQEGVSLAGMIETPIVVHIGQRPGPATGLPTRTEQGDLALALHAGHGDFARAIFAPGTTGEIIETMQRAFNLAQQLQMPVFMLTDQYLLDATCTIDTSGLAHLPPETSIIETSEDYRRYALTDDGLSPRGVPGHGSGIVRIDSDEHDEQGVITESFEVRRRMVEKRMKRVRSLAEKALMPTPIGRIADADTLVVCWGSNRGVVEEVLDMPGSGRIAGLHFAQPYPLNPSCFPLLDNRRIVVIENNATGQFADILSHESGCTVDRRILKSTGEPFSVEEVMEALREERYA